jgi:hypothetical protein
LWALQSKHRFSSVGGPPSANGVRCSSVKKRRSTQGTIAAERREVEAQIEAPSLHLHQMLDDLDHSVAFSSHQHRQTLHELRV